MHCPQFKSREGKNSSLSFLYSEFPGEPLRLCSSSGSNLQRGSRSPFWGRFLAVLASPAGGSHVPMWWRQSRWQRGQLGSPVGKTSPAGCLPSVPVPPGAAGLVGNARCAAGMLWEVCVGTVTLPLAGTGNEPVLSLLYLFYGQVLTPAWHRL